MAGLALGHVYGVAKEATLHVARVLDCQGSGDYAHVLAALDWIEGVHEQEFAGQRGVVLLSLGEYMRVKRACWWGRRTTPR